MQLPTEHFRWVTPGYFETIHLPLIAGRFLSSSDEGKHYAVDFGTYCQNTLAGQESRRPAI